MYYIRFLKLKVKVPFFMVRIGASVEREPLLSTAAYTAVQKKVARNVSHAATTKPQ